MPKTPKHETCSKGWCTEHIFSVTPISKSVYYKRIQKMRMCPAFNKNQKKFFKMFPLYNRDGKFYTPSFLIEEEKNFDNERDQRYRNNHIKRANENPSGVSQMFVPNLGRKNKYCNVCREDFDDYLEHIKSQGHKKSVNSNRYTTYIGEFAKKYKQSRLQITTCNTPSQNGLEESTLVQNAVIKSDKKPIETCEHSNIVNPTNQQVSIKID